MKSFPHLQMICTSDVFQGHVYIPAVNWAFMALTIIVVAAFGDSRNLTNAYGFSVATVMLSTSILIAVSMYYVKYWHWAVSVVFVVFFSLLDGKLPLIVAHTSMNTIKLIQGCSGALLLRRCRREHGFH